MIPIRPYTYLKYDFMHILTDCYIRVHVCTYAHSMCVRHELLAYVCSSSKGLDLAHMTLYERERKTYVCWRSDEKRNDCHKFLKNGTLMHLDMHNNILSIYTVF